MKNLDIYVKLCVNHFKKFRDHLLRMQQAGTHQGKMSQSEDSTRQGEKGRQARDKDGAYMRDNAQG